ncbi:Fat storage-inducing transmembrane protein [Catenaria anguillulae PL171]|uniref:Fat storage-inducing transmembrane protein n=1 Tax=Catenaria anguillulae PL171 TaxID=765915 RepID=A0A1Y2HX62_9FUNG|nr:Fat storage-inducing transmembrane protein [Catenaria anguillulae PL171]
MRHWTQERKLWAIVRYSMATGFWLALTQWFFGPSLLDRFNRQTGGSCTPSSALLHSLDPALRDHFSTNAMQAETLRDCRAYNGVWTHGHDVSGHCLLLIHSILFLNLEFLTHGNAAAAHTRPGATEQPQDERRARRPYRQAAKLIHGLTALWTLILVITMMYYHNLSELVNGIVAGTLFCAIAYSPVHMGNGNGGSA